NQIVANGHENGAVTIEPAVVEAVLDQIETGRVLLGEAGHGVFAERDDDRTARGEHVETPYLQLVMRRLWSEDVEGTSGEGSATVRLATLERLGGAERIVRTHLDATMEALSEHQRDVAAGIFHYLVTP